MTLVKLTMVGHETCLMRGKSFSKFRLKSVASDFECIAGHKQMSYGPLGESEKKLSKIVSLRRFHLSSTFLDVALSWLCCRNKKCRVDSELLNFSETKVLKVRPMKDF